MARDPEQSVLRAVSPSRLMEFTRGVSRWVRMSGGEDEAKAFDYLESLLQGFSLDVHRFHHDALVSWPGPASIEIITSSPRRLDAITHAFAASTPAGGLDAEVVDVGPGEFGRGEVRGRIVLLDGLATPVRARAAEDAGAVGAIFVNPPHLHEMIVSTVWGAPTPESLASLPKIVAVSIRDEDGAVLRAGARENSLRVRVQAQVDTRWRLTPLLIADLPGREEPDRYVLFSGHVDSWHYGAMDNGSANAVMVEMARIMSPRRRRLRRGIRFAFWSGHSHGRYSGSTWYADAHWEDLYHHAVLHLNIDSPGAAGATVLSEAETMAETWGLAARCIKDVCGQDLARRRISRMGDQSFWGIGLPSMFVDLSAQPADESPAASALASLSGGGRRTGGLGWWWHTPEDTLDKIDRSNLRRDAHIYALALWRWCTAPILPLDYEAAAAELRDILQDFQKSAEDEFDLSPPLQAVERLAEAAGRLNTASGRVGASLAAGRGTRRQRQAAQILNTALMRVGRALIPISYTTSGPFDHDRAVPVPPIPALQPVARLRTQTAGSTEHRALQTRLLRERNKITHAIASATEVIEDALLRLNGKRHAAQT